MAAGELDRRITVERLSKGVPNEFNEPEELWTKFITLWARRRDVSDGEKVAAGQAGSTLISRFKIRSGTKTRTITPVDRISYDDALWNITGVKETSEGRNRFLEITAIRSADIDG